MTEAKTTRPKAGRRWAAVAAVCLLVPACSGKAEPEPRLANPGRVDSRLKMAPTATGAGHDDAANKTKAKGR